MVEAEQNQRPLPVVLEVVEVRRGCVPVFVDVACDDFESRSVSAAETLDASDESCDIGVSDDIMRGW